MYSFHYGLKQNIKKFYPRSCFVMIYVLLKFVEYSH